MALVDGTDHSRHWKLARICEMDVPVGIDPIGVSRFQRSQCYVIAIGAYGGEPPVVSCERRRVERGFRPSHNRRRVSDNPPNEVADRVVGLIGNLNRSVSLEFGPTDRRLFAERPERVVQGRTSRRLLFAHWRRLAFSTCPGH